MSTAETTRPRTLRNFAFSGACKVVTGLSSLVVSVIIARSLGASEMGTYSFVVWVAGAIAAFSALGLPDAVAKYVAEQIGVGNDALAAKIARKIIVTQLLAAGAASLIGASVWSAISKHQLILIFLALATVMPAALQQMLLALLEGAQRFDLQLIATLSGSLCQVGVVVAFAVRHASIQGFLLANVLSSAAFTGFIFILCRPVLNSGPAASGHHQVSPEISKRIFNFSISVYALSLLSLIVFDKSEMFFLRVFQTPAELAYYSIAFGLTARIATAGDSVSYVLFPMFVTRYAQNGPDDLREAYWQSMRYLQLVMVPIIFWSIPLAPRLVILTYGGQYAHVASVVQVLLGTMLFTVMLTVSASVIFALDKQRLFFRCMLVVAVLNIGLDIAFIPRYGALGAAFANGLSQVCAVCGLIALLGKELPGSFPAVASLKVYVAAAVSSAAIFYADLVMRGGVVVLCISVAAAILVYLSLLRGTRAVTGSEVAALRGGLMACVSGKQG